METLNEGETLNKIKKGLKGAAIGAGVLGATATGITGYGAVNGVRQARAEKIAQERQATEKKAAKEKYANDLAQNLHKKGVELKDFAGNAFDKGKVDVKDAATVMKLLKSGEITSQEAKAMLKEIKKNKDKPIGEEVSYFPY